MPNQPLSIANPANAVTLVRALGAIAIWFAVAANIDLVAGWIGFGCALTLLILDGVDGWLARTLSVETRFGARFDMETDALFILILCYVVIAIGKAGIWVLIAGLARYGFVAAGWVWPWLRSPLPPSKRRQMGCVLPTATLIGCLSPIVTPPLSQGLALVGVVVVIASFAIDIRWLHRRRRRPINGFRQE